MMAGDKTLALKSMIVDFLALLVSYRTLGGNAVREVAGQVD